MWHDVPNRGGRLTIVPIERATGDIGLSSGWQGDNSGRHRSGRRTTTMSSCRSPRIPTARPSPAGCMARIINAIGQEFAADDRHSNPMPYRPASLDTKAGDASPPTPRRRIDGRDRRDRRRSRPATGPSPNAAPNNPFPGTPDPTQICLKNGFDPNAALSGGVHRQGPAGAGHRLCRLPRRRLVLPQCRPGRCRHAQSARRRSVAGRSPAASRNRAISCAASCISASTRTKPAARSMTARGRSSPAGASAQHALRDARRRAASSTRPAAKARNGGRDAPDPVRGLPAAGILDRCNATPYLPEDHRAFRRRGSLGPEADAGMGRHGRRHGHAAARQCAPLLHRQHAARRRRAAASAPRRRPRRPVPASTGARACFAANPDAAHRDGQCDARRISATG